MNSTLEKLKEVLRKDNTVLFVGSGISTWSNLPTWEGMMDSLSQICKGREKIPDLINNETKAGNLLQAASYGYEELTNDEKVGFMSKTYIEGFEPHPIHNALVSLGPTCFITTNYDHLIEEAVYRKRGKSPTICLNNDVPVMGRIIRADSRNFVFKPHGDAGKIDTVVMTRSHYRELMPHGEFHAAVETLRILLMTRPVVYIGFGFRDPDFAYVRDILGNLYQGATSAHYAIMADVPPHVEKFWRKHDGIHIISYETTLNAIGSERHSSLLHLLKDLGE
ncbi:hypothetical protein GJ700_01395 [Duganella sp. FT92W]|uniref:SIR2-like domain-containing protein n=1 Tax=Pseudoduganella rivuli TaxID=2666085 RepID=A0A7X2IIE4_9BURK|nr:SIR2 family protein [Pseudoduganella rivuli]MRV70375.1 hypothetical protein [Pseudoduganella rivuli]